MFKKDIGNLVAQDMLSILNSDEHKKLFKKANKDESEDMCSAKDGACPCPADCECHAKLGKSHLAEKCDCSTKEAAKKAFNEIISLSSVLDDLGFGKAAQGLLDSANMILVKAAEGFGDEVDTPEEMADEIKSEIEVLESVDPGELEFLETYEDEDDDSYEDVDLGELEEVQDEDESDAELDALLKELEQAGDEVYEPQEEEYEVVDEGDVADVTALASEVDAWVNKNADEDLLTLFAYADKSGLDVSLKELSDDLISNAMEKADDEEADDGEEEDFEDED